jgi:O-Antigen ligase
MTDKPHRMNAAARQSQSLVPTDGIGLWLTFFCVALLGYALAGKGWAYIGIPPFFLGEALLVVGGLWLLLLGPWSRLLSIPCVWWLVLLGAWGALQTFPYLSRYGSEALRDAVIWGYGAFALIVCGSLLAQPSRLVGLIRAYRRFAVVFLAVMPLEWIALRIYPRPALPHWPGTEIAILEPKGGDLLVHVAGILAFIVSGLGGRVSSFFVLPLAACILLAGAYDRAGLLSFLAVFGLCFLFRPRHWLLWALLGIAACGMLLLAATDLHLRMPQREREISFDQLTANLTSTVSSSHAGDLDDTKEWRLEWWSDILDYTLHGKYFWTGKGFGINLADDDGYQVEADGSLRSPHNGHLMILARAGVPGFLLWAAVQLSWAWILVVASLRSGREGNHAWSALFFFLLAYWLAFMINGTFDVFLEGPMGGIWFWTIYGVGLAAVWLRNHAPEYLQAAFAVGAPHDPEPMAGMRLPPPEGA